MWNLPGPGIEPVSSTLAGGFLSTVPPGKSLEMGNRRQDKSAQTNLTEVMLLFHYFPPYIS